MLTLRLLPALHREQAIIKVSFPYNRDLIDKIKRYQDTRWSQTLKSWYFLKKDFNLNTFYHDFKGIAYLDYAPLSKKKTVRKTENNIQIQLPKAYKELLLLKRYSPNTIKTYCSCFFKVYGFL